MCGAALYCRREEDLIHGGIMRSLMLVAGAILTLTVATGATAQTVGDADAGKKVYNKCRACHAVGEGAKNKVGPELNGIIGEKPGSIEDYKYSAGFEEWAADKTAWNEALMTEWLADPRAVVKGTKMAFPGLKKPEDLTNVIAYLASFDAEGKERDPAEALAAAAEQ
ncbi:c-type cytochrome [Aurantimonas marianensis]|uniref:Cytochrome c family protein n=1 Tax=Aurantimonas marianensis TaxID=2920428 RepID=A0A9X2H833_9HYPH|nr:cytochrome c family protein [Aurantimonas marianensis]MCP3056031.1 cytochrome c family protein [Aurantimonas marianensis]